MQRAAIAVLMVLVGAPLPAVEIPFRDGSVVEALGYTVTGSYVFIELSGGARVAYDVADVDLETLIETEKDEEPEVVPDQRLTKLGVSGALTLPEEKTPDGLAITDRDVMHVSGGGEEASEAGEQQEPAEGDAETGEGVQLSGLLAVPLDDGRYRITADVVNGTQDAVHAVRANVSVAIPDRAPWTEQVSVASILAAGETAELSRVVSLPAGGDDSWRPAFQVNLVWMSSERLPNNPGP